MKYNIERYLKTLELDKILELLANETTVLDATENATKIIPENNIDNVKTLLSRTEAAYLFMSRYTTPSFGAAVNVNSSLARAQSGGVLTLTELLDICETLRVIRSLKDWRENCSSMQNSAIDFLFDNLYPNKFLEDKINFAIKNKEELNDNASPVLYDIRRKIIAKSAKIRDILEKIVHGPSAKYLQEAIVTQRDGSRTPLKSSNIRFHNNFSIFLLALSIT